MFLKKNTTRELPIIIGISIYAFYINWYSGNIGVMPIDSFGFLDTSHSILNNNLPIRDFWIFTGLVVDYMGALFLFIFGNNWNSHLIHSSFMNILVVIVIIFYLSLFFFVCVCVCTCLFVCLVVLRVCVCVFVEMNRVFLSQGARRLWRLWSFGCSRLLARMLS